MFCRKNKDFKQEINFLKYQIRSVKSTIKTFKKLGKDTTELESWLYLYKRILSKFN